MGYETPEGRSRDPEGFSEISSCGGRRQTMDKVAGFLEVGRTNDTHEVVISHPNPKLDANGTARIVFSPRYARYLANLLATRRESGHPKRSLARAHGRRHPW